jgi:hypothetical protein
LYLISLKEIKPGIWRIQNEKHLAMQETNNITCSFVVDDFICSVFAFSCVCGWLLIILVTERVDVTSALWICTSGISIGVTAVLIEVSRDFFESREFRATTISFQILPNKSFCHLPLCNLYIDMTMKYSSLIILAIGFLAILVIHYLFRYYMWEQRAIGRPDTKQNYSSFHKDRNCNLRSDHPQHGISILFLIVR